MSDLDILARTIYGEARGEGSEGMEAVACVVMNRYRSHKWYCGYTWMNGMKVPSIAQTCLKRYQFSCWNKNDPNLEKVLKVTAKDPQFQDCLLVAKRAISGDLKDFTNGAVYYHNTKITPYWAKEKSPCYEVGHHRFYRES